MIPLEEYQSMYYESDLLHKVTSKLLDFFQSKLNIIAFLNY